MAGDANRPATLTLTVGGYTDLPPGVVAAVTTYLEMSERPPQRAAPARPDLSFTRLDLTRRRPAALDAYRHLYDRIGRDLMWFSRAGLSDASLADLLTAEGIEVYVAHRADTAVGLVEFDRHHLEGQSGDDVEIVYFGLVPEAIGDGAGRWLMEQTLDRAFARTVRRLWLHTCNYDHPAALDFYRRSGFTPYKSAIELALDPRLTGRLPRDAAPQVPIFDAAP